MALTIKLDLLNPIRSTKLLDVAAVQGAINTALDEAAKALKEDLAGPTETWNNAPEFVTSTPAPGERLVETDSPVYNWLDEGTDGPYDIKPKHAKRLRFTVPFTPKTSASFTSGPGGRGPTVRYERAVKHPGIKPRSWVERIQKVWEDRELPKRIDQALASATR